MKITILGTAYPYRGGLTAFNERLARELQDEGHEVEIVTFRMQYPSFLFPGKTQYSQEPAPEGLKITRMLNSVNPFNWFSTARRIRKAAPDLLIIKFWMPFMAPCLGTVARIVKRGGKTRVVTILDNLIPHEKRPGDSLLIRYFCGSVDKYVAMSKSVLADIDKFDRRKPRVFRPHPIYDNFGEPVSRAQACSRLGLDPEDKNLLFFGLIRDYKGLDMLLKAYPAVVDKAKLVVAGEFYGNEDKYHALAKSLGIDDKVVWLSRFIPDSEVRYCFCAADLIVQPYRSATQSGVTQIAYHFGKPMLVTNVGGLPEIVPDGQAGYVVEPDPEKISTALEDFLSRNPDFSEGLEKQKQEFSWKTFVQAVITR